MLVWRAWRKVLHILLFGFLMRVHTDCRKPQNFYFSFSVRSSTFIRVEDDCNILFIGAIKVQFVDGKRKSNKYSRCLQILFVDPSKTSWNTRCDSALKRQFSPQVDHEKCACDCVRNAMCHISQRRRPLCMCGSIFGYTKVQCSSAIHIQSLPHSSWRFRKQANTFVIATEKPRDKYGKSNTDVRFVFIQSESFEMK